MCLDIYERYKSLILNDYNPNDLYRLGQVWELKRLLLEFDMPVPEYKTCPCGCGRNFFPNSMQHQKIYFDDNCRHRARRKRNKELSCVSGD
jgi:hypothetical protein